MTDDRSIPSVPYVASGKLDDGFRKAVRQLADEAMADGQKLAFDSAITLCKKLALEMKGDFSVGASLCADLIEKMRDGISAGDQDK